MIVQLRVLIGLKPDAMARASRSRQERRGGPTVKVVDHVVTSRPDLPRHACACGEPAAAFEDDNIVDVRMPIEHWRDPIFDEDVDLSIRQKPFQRE